MRKSNGIGVKVETIGDGYFCVSGLPNRNGNKHAHEIAKMALEAVKCYQMMKVNELPEFKIAARIGIHTGFFLMLNAKLFCLPNQFLKVSILLKIIATSLFS